jgi:flagellar biosynthetic protein FliR
MPVSAAPIHGGDLFELATWGGKDLQRRLQLALPIVAALLITNVALGILTRAAPQLNLFGIGFPITLGAGFLVLMISLPYLSTPLLNLFHQGTEQARRLPRALQGKGDLVPQKKMGDRP